MYSVTPEVVEEVRRLKEQFLSMVAFYKANGYDDHKAEYFSVHPKITAYKLLLSQGLEPKEVVAFFKELDVVEGE